MKHLLTIFALLVACLWVGSAFSSPPSGGNFGGTGAVPDETIVNIHGQDDPFELIMAEIIPRLLDEDVDCSAVGAVCNGAPDTATPRIIKIVGHATVTEADFADRGDFRVGILLCASNATQTTPGAEASYPEPYGGGAVDGDSFSIDYQGDLTIDFTDAKFTVDQTAATERLVPIKFGCNYETGWREDATSTEPGNMIQGLVVKGTPVIEFTNGIEDDDGGGSWNAGHVPHVWGAGSGIGTLVDGGGGTTDMNTTVDHELSVGELITIAETDNYNAVTWQVSAIVDSDTYTLATAWVAGGDLTGTWKRTHSSIDSSIAIWEDGLLRSNLTDFSPRIICEEDDDDNLGYVHGVTGYMVDRGNISVTGCSVGIYVHGNTVGKLVSGGFAEENDTNMVIGDPYTGDGMKPSDIAVKGADFRDLRFDQPFGFSVNNFTIEPRVAANTFGNLAIFSGKHITFNNLWAEQGTSPAGHNIAIAGGWTDTSFLPCVFNGEVGAETCIESAGGGIEFQNIVFASGWIGGDSTDATFDGLAIGDQWDYPGWSLKLGGFWNASDCGGADPGRLFCINNVWTSGTIDVTNVQTVTNILPPEYMFVSHDKAKIYEALVTDQISGGGPDHGFDPLHYSFATNTLWYHKFYSVMMGGRASTTGAAFTDGDSVGDHWNVAYLGLRIADLINATGCEALVVSDVRADTVTDMSFTLGSAASTITYGTGGCGGTCDLDAVQESAMVAVMDSIADGYDLGVLFNDNTGACWDVGGNDSLAVGITLFPRFDR